MAARRRLAAILVAILLTLGVGVASVGTAHAQSFAPAAGTAFTGVTAKPVSAYTNFIHKHPAVYQEFVAWGQWLPSITQDAITNQARLMMAITTAYGDQNVLSPGQIAAGLGDAWLIGLGAQIAASGNVTYVRLMAEMDNAANPYCAFNANGSSRGAAFSTSAYKQAWRRVTLILRGGSVATIDASLSGLGLPPLNTTATDLAAGKVAMVWVPMVSGSPDIAANLPRAYFPGRAYVDWVGTDFYSRYPNFSGLSGFYRAYPGYPFAFGEYALWGNGSPTFVNKLFAWIRTRNRVGMLVYNDAGADFWLSNYGAGARTLNARLQSARFLAYAPGW